MFAAIFGLGPVELIIIIVIVIVLFVPTLLPKLVRTVSETITAIRSSSDKDEDDGVSGK